ncbi:hypothetical protein AVEN_233781-1 [Araneus ventricosus]|uniref:Uncharacterized protein n=1 Tax=Araneus ventricosus TaxID=182803 RepID=A0A4Y2IBP5_ARAVE|nr:hypothetical protein AVEN_233781-1 [Araneus ventricosus]
MTGEKTKFSHHRRPGKKSDVTIRNCFRHGGFIRTKQEDNPDVIEKPTDLSEEDYEALINIDANFETVEKETICQAWMKRRDDGIQLEDNDNEEELEEKTPSAQETPQALRTERNTVLNLSTSIIHMKDSSLSAANRYIQTAPSSVCFVYLTAHKFIGLHDSDFDDYVRSVLYDNNGEEFYEERQSRSSNRGLQQQKSPDLLENQENSYIEIDDSGTDPDYVATESGNYSDMVHYGYHLEVDTSNHLLSLILSSPPATVSVHIESSNNGLLIKPTFGHLSHDMKKKIQDILALCEKETPTSKKRHFISHLIPERPEVAAKTSDRLDNTPSSLEKSSETPILARTFGRGRQANFAILNEKGKLSTSVKSVTN